MSLPLAMLIVSHAVASLMKSDYWPLSEAQAVAIRHTSGHTSAHVYMVGNACDINDSSIA